MVLNQTMLWQYPPLSLLDESQGGTANRGNVKQIAQTIEKTLEAFKIHAEVVEVNPGPSVTQYAISIPTGIKISDVRALADEIAMAVSSPTGNVLVNGPIPGKSLIGIEIPNQSSVVVNLKNILSSDQMRANKSKLAVGLGLDVAGNTVITDIGKLPYLLVAGTTGSGKSVLVRAILTTLLFRASPQEVKLILMDPSKIELSQFNDIPHLLTPVIVEPDKSLSALKWVLQEMNRRYKLFQESGVLNIYGYNELSGFQALPFVIIIIDGFQNLVEFAPIEIEDALMRLASMGRPTGIHLIITTQRPSVDVITGLIKAKMPGRISFMLPSQVDSRVILDNVGAEKLLGGGEMLFLPPDVAKPIRTQGVYVSDNEIKNLVEFLKKSGFLPEYSEEKVSMSIGKNGSNDYSDNNDDLIKEAVKIVCQYDRASHSLLQRRLRIGFSRAARIMDELEILGVVSSGGSEPREVLIKNFDDFLAKINSS